MSVDGRALTRRGAMAPGELSPLGADVAPERRALAEALREVFTLLKTSVGEFAADCHRDKGAVSRYLSGKRLPPRDFVDDLLSEVARVSDGQAIARSAQGRLRALHLQALEAHDPHAAKIQMLEDDLRHQAERKAALEAELACRTGEIDSLRGRTRSADGPRQRETPDVPDVIEDLHRQLQEAVDKRREAEKRLILERARASARSRPEDQYGILGCIM